MGMFVQNVHKPRHMVFMSILHGEFTTPREKAKLAKEEVLGQAAVS